MPTFSVLFLVSLLIQESGKETRAGDMDQILLVLLSVTMPAVGMTIGCSWSISYLFPMWSSQKPLDKDRTGFISCGAEAANVGASNLLHMVTHTGNWKKSMHLQMYKSISVSVPVSVPHSGKWMRLLAPEVISSEILAALGLACLFWALRRTISQHLWTHSLPSSWEVLA